MQLKVARWGNVKGPLVIGFMINSFKLIKRKNSSKQLQVQITGSRNGLERKCTMLTK
jgi:hypothetical protein